VVGAIDGSHIRVKPPINNPHPYFCEWKKAYSIILLAVAREDKRITWANIGHPGRTKK
jgi:hypothetical protein